MADTVLEVEGLRAGYGSTLKASSVSALASAATRPATTPSAIVPGDESAVGIGRV